MESLLYATKIDKTSVAAAAAQTAITDGDIIDLQDCDSVTGIAALGEVTTTSIVTLKAFTGDVATLTDGAYETVTATVTALVNSADNKLLVLDIIKCGKRYVRFDLTRTVADAVIDSIIAVRYNFRTLPTVQGSDVSHGKISVN